MRAALPLALVPVCWSACTEPAPDAVTTPTAADAAVSGSGPDARDPADAAPPPVDDLPLDGFGDLSGACDVLDDELSSAAPARLDSSIDFPRPFSDADAALLTAGGQEILAAGNAGGSSLYSEVFAFEVLARCELATLLETETEISYDVEGKRTDLLVLIDGLKIGVSVTRAVAFPFDRPYPVDEARDLLQRKLDDVLASSAGVSEEDRWVKQVLAILAYGPGHADALVTAYEQIPAPTRADTLVWIVVTDGADDFVYCDGPCAGAAAD